MTSTFTSRNLSTPPSTPFSHANAPSPMLAHIVVQLFLSALAAGVHTLIVSAPKRCGGRHLITHAFAFFGPRPGGSQIANTHSRCLLREHKADGNYIRLIHSTPRKFQASRRQHVGAWGIWRRLAKLILVAMHVIRLRGWREPTRNEQSDDKGTDPAMDSGVCEEPAKIDMGSALETFAMARGGDTAGRSDIGGLEHADSTPFVLFHACRLLSVPGDIQAMSGRVVVVARRLRLCRKGRRGAMRRCRGGYCSQS